MTEVLVPRLHTERTVMREWRDEDLEAYAAMGADAAVMRFIGGTVSRPEAWRMMALHAGHWQPVVVYGIERPLG